MSEDWSQTRALRSDARHAEKVIGRLLLEWDAIGGGVVPDDEFDCMIWRLYRLIRQCSSNEEIAEWVGDFRRDHFGLEDDREADAELAERLVVAFANR